MDWKSVKLVHFLLVAAFVTVSVGVDFEYDCRRSQVADECGTGNTCNVETGDCVCTSGSTHYQCEDITESGTCDPSCLNGGTCVNSTCSCTDSYYGDICEISRVFIACDNDIMFLNVYPHGNFNGLIYVYNQANLNECSLQPGSGNPSLKYDTNLNADQLLGWRLEIPYTDPNCGNAQQEGNSSDASTTYQRDFFVQYNKLFRSSLDQIITAKCTIVNSGTATISSDVRTVKEQEQNFQNVTVDDDVDLVTFDVMNGDGTSELNGDVLLGQEIKLVFAIIPDKGFKDFSLSTCTANNDEPQGATYKEVTIVENGCPTPQATALFYGMIEKSDDGVTVKRTVSLKAFMFAGTSPRVAFVCDLELCSNDTATCPAEPVCSGVSNGQITTSTDTGGNSTTTLAPSNSTEDANATTAAPQAGRRKREAGNDQQVTKTTTIRVIDPLAQISDDVQKEPEEKECMDESTFVATIIVLVLMMLLLIILVIILLVRMLRTRNKVSANRSERYSEPVQTMRIPRLELNTSGSSPSC